MMKSNFYFENNCIVLTEQYLLERGHCCGEGCRHCPYKGKVYLLKTNTDLFFHINSDDRKLNGINVRKVPFCVNIDDENYVITSCEVVQCQLNQKK